MKGDLPESWKRSARAVRALPHGSNSRTRKPKIVGYTNARAPAVTAFNGAVTAILADTSLATAMGGDAIHVSDRDSFSATLRCHVNYQWFPSRGSRIIR